MGVRIHHPTHGQVESMLHRAWLVQGFAGLAEGEADRKQVAVFSTASGCAARNGFAHGNLWVL